jgi:hypothetical protein
MMSDDELDLIRYELPRTLVRRGESRIVVTKTASPGGQAWPVGLEVDPGAAPRLVVDELWVGRNAPWISNSGVPATLFADLPTVSLCCDRVPPGLSVALRLTCVGPGDADFKGRLLVSSRGRGRTWVVGFGHVDVEAGASVEVSTTPECRVRLTRLHVPFHLLGTFRVDDLSLAGRLDVGPSSLLAGLGKRDFSRGGMVDLAPSTAEIGSPLVLKVTNTSRASRTFSAVLLGEPLW